MNNTPQNQEPVLSSAIDTSEENYGARAEIQYSDGVGTVIQIVRNAGFRIFIAGGAVRDLVLGKTPKDIDLVTDGKSDDISEALEDAGIKVLTVGKQFGVTMAVIEGEQIEIATMRTDGESSDGRHPDSVEFTHDPGVDAQRRDMTVNALLYDPETCLIADYVEGMQDIHEGKLRFVDDPAERIQEDRIRMLRYARFLRKTGFKPDEASENAIRKNAHLITGVSGERIKDELEKLFSIRPVSEGLRRLKDLGLLAYVLPEVDALSDCGQAPPYHMEENVFEHTCMTADSLPEDVPMELCWAAILHDIAKPATRREKQDEGGKPKVSFLNHDKQGAEMAEEVCRRLKFPNEATNKIVWLIENHQYILQLAEMKLSKAKQLILNKELNALHPYAKDLLTLAEADANASIPEDENVFEGKIEAIIERFRAIEAELEAQKNAGVDIKKLIRGKDVMDTLGLKQGAPVVGELLNAVKEQLLELSVEEQTREKGMEILKELAPSYQQS